MKKTIVIAIIAGVLMLGVAGLNARFAGNTTGNASGADSQLASDSADGTSSDDKDSGDASDGDNSGASSDNSSSETNTSDEKGKSSKKAKKEKSYEELGLVKKGDDVYYPDENGEYQTGWQQIDDHWYYFDDEGKMLTGKQTINGVMYYFNKRGKMRTGWIEFEDGKYYYAEDKGNLLTGLQFVKKNDRYYWFDDDGVLWGNFTMLSSGEIGLVRETMGTWNDYPEMTQDRLNVLSRALYLVSRVTYNQHKRNEPSAENPSYLDCSSYVANCFYYGDNCTDVLPNFWTDIFLYQDQFKTISKDELVPGDIFLEHANGSAAAGNHIGIYLGQLTGGQHIFIHCAGDVSNESNNIENRGIWVTDREDDEIYRRYHAW